MLDFFATVRRRHSIRHYQADMPVGDPELNAILEAAIAAPSAGDLQAYRIIAVREQALRQALAQAAKDQVFVGEAPICLVFCADTERSAAQFGERGQALFALQDTTIAAAYAQLAAVASDLSATWVGQFDERAIAGLLELEANLQPVALLCIGYAAELPEPSTRRRLGDVVSWR